MTTYIPVGLRRLVIDRANGRCGYCLIPQLWIPSGRRSQSPEVVEQCVFNSLLTNTKEIAPTSTEIFFDGTDSRLTPDLPNRRTMRIT